MDIEPSRVLILAISFPQLFLFNNKGVPHAIITDTCIYQNILFHNPVFPLLTVYIEIAFPHREKILHGARILPLVLLFNIANKKVEVFRDGKPGIC